MLPYDTYLDELLMNVKTAASDVVEPSQLQIAVEKLINVLVRML